MVKTGAAFPPTVKRDPPLPELCRLLPLAVRHLGRSALQPRSPQLAVDDLHLVGIVADVVGANQGDAAARSGRIFLVPVTVALSAPSREKGEIKILESILNFDPAVIVTRIFFLSCQCCHCLVKIALVGLAISIENYKKIIFHPPLPSSLVVHILVVLYSFSPLQRCFRSVRVIFCGIVRQTARRRGKQVWSSSYTFGIRFTIGNAMHLLDCTLYHCFVCLDIQRSRIRFDLHGFINWLLHFCFFFC